MDAIAYPAALAAVLGLIARNAPSAPKRRVGRQGRKVQVNSRSSGPNSMQPLSRADLAVVVPTPFNVPRGIPRSVASQIAWDSVKLETTITASTSGVVETNYVATLSLHPQASSWQTLFDQFSIPAFTVVFESQLAPGATFNPVSLVTALDFDSSSNIGSVSALEDYSTSESKMMGCGAKVMRSIRPCPKIVAQQPSGNASSIVAGPQWLDCASPGNSVTFNAIRSILEQASTAYVIRVTQTVFFCFRNQI